MHLFPHIPTSLLLLTISTLLTPTLSLPLPLPLAIPHPHNLLCSSLSALGSSTRSSASASYSFCDAQQSRHQSQTQESLTDSETQPSHHRTYLIVPHSTDGRPQHHPHHDNFPHPSRDTNDSTLTNRRPHPHPPSSASALRAWLTTSTDLWASRRRHLVPRLGAAASHVAHEGEMGIVRLYDYERMHILEKVRNMPAQVREMVLGAVVAVVAMMALCVVMIRRARGTMAAKVDIEAWKEEKGSNGEKNVAYALTSPPPLMSSRTW